MPSNKADEILEALWIFQEEKTMPSIPLKVLKVAPHDPALAELIKSGSVVVSASGAVRLTDAGRQEGRDIVRRHRLAERLLTDVLDIKGDLIDESACEFEHILHKGIDDHICTLLGHPEFCPHGYPIPRGECCQGQETAPRIIARLAEMTPNQSGKIAYLHSEDQEKLRKMMAMGILPGTDIRLISNFPSFLFQTGHSQFAVDETIAENVFVRITEA